MTRDLYGHTKRAFDVAAALVALILLAPVLALIAIVVRVSSPGPILFRQLRVGREGHLFTMYKFRTMRVGAPDWRNPDGTTFNASDDPRMTPAGRFLRSTSADELPQLWNVLSGDMSLVGGRPDLPSGVEGYTPRQRDRLLVRPGLTSLAIVRGRNNVPLDERLDLDAWYAHHATFSLDIQIIAKTLWIVARREGVTNRTHAGARMTLPLAELPFLVTRSTVDEALFGVVTTRALVTTVAEVDCVMSHCRRDGTQLLILRCATSDLGVAQAVEAAGGRLMDTLLSYVRDGAPSVTAPEDSPVSLRSATSHDGPALARIARDAFADFRGHYHADPRLAPEQCNEVYAAWAERSVAMTGEGVHVFVAEDAGMPIGFVSVRINDAGDAEMVLNAVSPRAQKRGVYRQLVIRAMHWSHAEGATRLVASTQATNIAPQKVWCRLGFEPYRSFYTFHAWFPQ